MRGTSQMFGDEESTFGKCATCGKLRWVSSEALKRQMGWRCSRCGTGLIRQAGNLNVFERFHLVYWIFWEHVKINPGSMWYFNPLNLWRIVNMGMKPKLYRGEPEQDGQSGRESKKPQPSHLRS